MAYEKVGWKDYPDKSTPVNSKNLEHMDGGILANAAAIGNADKIAQIGDGTLSGAVAEHEKDIEQLNTDLKNCPVAPKGVITQVETPNNRYTATDNCYMQVDFHNGGNSEMAVGLHVDYGLWISSRTAYWEDLHLFVPLNAGQSVSIVQNGDHTGGYDAYIIPIAKN